MRVKGKNVTVLYFETENPLTGRKPQEMEVFKRNLETEVKINLKMPAGGLLPTQRRLGAFYALHGKIPSTFLFSQLTGLEMYVGYPLSIMAINGVLHFATIICNRLCLFEISTVEYSLMKKIESGLIPMEQQDKATYRVITDDITESVVQALKGKRPYSFYGSEVLGGEN